MSVVIPDEVLDSARLSEQQFLQEVAVLLFAQDRLTLAQASQLARMNRLQFQQLLASRKLNAHYDTADFEEDMSTLRRMDRL